jgi:hypothetical protein
VKHLSDGNLAPIEYSEVVFKLMSCVLILSALFIYLYIYPNCGILRGTVSGSYYAYWNSWFVDKWIAKEIEGNCRGLLEVLSHFQKLRKPPRVIFVNTAGLQPSFEPGTSGKLSRNAVWCTELIVIAKLELIFRGSDSQVVTVTRIYNLSRVVGARHIISLLHD